MFENMNIINFNIMSPLARQLKELHQNASQVEFIENNPRCVTDSWANLNKPGLTNSDIMTYLSDVHECRISRHAAGLIRKILEAGRKAA